MKLSGIFVAIALTSSPMPADNYYSWISPEISETIIDCVIREEYREYLDFNGDGILSMADAVGVAKRYQDNCKYGNKITMDRETVEAIVMENYTDEAIYWEIDRINGQLCRQYELTVDDIATAEIYLEFSGFSECVTVELNPYTETITVIE